MSLTGTPAEATALLASLRFAYRLVDEAEWALAQEQGAYKGSALDEKDGFLHLSLPGEVLTTARLYYGAHAGPLLVLKVDLRAVPGAELRADWVEGRKNFFPHIVGSAAGSFHVPTAAVAAVRTLTRAADGAWEGFNAAFEE